MATLSAELTRTSPVSRTYGLRSISGKTIDSRLAFIIAAGVLGGLSLVAVPTAARAVIGPR
jgi:hypothetical protein